MAYLTYDEYEGYGGTLAENEFYMAEFRARKTIDYWTDSRVAAMAQVPESVKRCIMAIIKLDSKYGAEAQVENPLLASFNTDGYSESYGSASEQQAAAKRAIGDCVKQWLYGETDDEGTPLLYRGIRL